MDVSELFVLRVGDQKICRWWWPFHSWGSKQHDERTGLPMRKCNRCLRVEVQVPLSGWWNKEIVDRQLKRLRKNK